MSSLICKYIEKILHRYLLFFLGTSSNGKLQRDIANVRCQLQTTASPTCCTYFCALSAALNMPPGWPFAVVTKTSVFSEIRHSSSFQRSLATFCLSGTVFVLFAIFLSMSFRTSPKWRILPPSSGNWDKFQFGPYRPTSDRGFTPRNLVYCAYPKPANA